jgi:hypothetical protein
MNLVMKTMTKIRTKGQTWRVGKGRVRLTEGGMSEYVALVEKRIEKKMKELGMESSMK